ncbi:hypothetical protein DJ69_14365 [Halorubrum persicum]|uniref:DUF8135 domain-containing protein n=1 Tax=Halorubrum persicum TaxID=1383844 RepID=A0A2G1WGH8_9EURY|nr:hypothetical protein [Halorubrum persicum]PHQ37969.1 hypothetical protein DJ69_14365 [Halorubrum persicum]
MTDDEADPFADADEGESESADELFGDESIEDAGEVDDPFAELDDDISGENASEIDVDAEGPDPAEAGPESAEPESADAGRPLFGEAKTDAREPDADADGDRGAVGGRSAADAGRGETDDPFDELGPATGETDADLDDMFEQMDVGSVGDEDVWESLDEDAAGAGLREGFVDADVERVISKRTYCQQCPHFSAPPTVACDHEGTTILEAVGFDEFRVRNCPMVDEDDPTFDASRGE